MSPTIVIPIGWTAPAPRPCTTRKTISAAHAPRHAAQQRPDHEQPDADQHHRLAPDRSASLP